MEPFTLAVILRELCLVAGVRAQTRKFRRTILHYELVVRAATGLQCQKGHTEQPLVIARTNKLCGVRGHKPLVGEAEPDRHEKRQDQKQHDQQKGRTGKKPACRRLSCEECVHHQNL